MEHGATSGSSILTAIVTGFVAGIPVDALSYVEKLGSVFVLAIVAELGRRLVALLWKGKKKS